MIVTIDPGEDNTEAQVRTIQNDKIKIIHTCWDMSKRAGGVVYADETNKALDAVSKESDWIFYIQADEVIHEKDHNAILKAAHEYEHQNKVEGLLFHYIHFYGTYDYVGVCRQWYGYETRMIKNNSSIRSYKDAQGFRKNQEKLKVKAIDAHIYHYGWVKNPQLQKAKQMDFGKLWMSDEKAIKKHQAYLESLKNGFLYEAEVDSLKNFDGTHPSVMKERIANADWQFEFDINKKHFRDFKSRLLYAVEKATGVRLFDYKNYKII